MPERVRIPKDKESLILTLQKTDNDKGIFNTRADIITFAGALGYSRHRRIPFTDSLEPIRQDVFISRKYDTVINLLAIGETKDPKILMNTDQADQERIKIFEEYANGGLQILIEELKGTVNTLDHFLLMIKNEKEQRNNAGQNNVLSNFLNI